MKKILIKTTEAGGYNRETTSSGIIEVDNDWVQEKEEGTIYYNTHVDNYNYFSMIDNQVRKQYAKCEEYSIKPIIEKIYKDAGVDTNSIKKYPVEGYYYKTPGLRKYFQLVRNLQENPNVYSKVVDSKEVEEITWLLGNTIWGTIPSARSLTTFPRMKDIMTHTTNGLKYQENWTIPNIMKTIEKYATGNTNLVELAFLTGDIRCLTAGCETNALYREMGFCLASGCMMPGVTPQFPKEVHVYHWDVSENIDEMGPKLVDKYNEVINRFQNSDMLSSYKAYDLIEPNLLNFETLVRDLESPRVAMLGQCVDDRKYYHWILDKNEVKEKWSSGIITTETYINKKDPIEFDDWDMSGVEEEDENGNKTINMNKLWGTSEPGFDNITLMGDLNSGDITIRGSDIIKKV